MSSIVLNIEEMRIARGLSKNKLAQRAEMERTQLNKYLNNDIRLIDVNVLARLCDALECKPSDIITLKTSDDLNNKLHPSDSKSTD